MMDSTNTCPKCGKPLPPDAPAGLCPACLLKEGLEPESAQTIDSESGEPQSEGTGEYTPQPDETPSSAGAATGFRLSMEPGTVIAGRYTLVEKIGEGGMGEVWVARQTEPVKRRVALKLIKTGMDSRAVLSRFEAERQALAMMDHPNIARVLDGGMTGQSSRHTPCAVAADGTRSVPATLGQPFFVMELVNGLSLTKFCDEATLTPKERLELFVPICQAVQHAHQKGIVHRDLKPANILVTIIDGRPVPKVIDFGVAKAIEEKLTDEAMETQFGAVVGTLEYMSPEQASFSGVDIDTRADIYSLGVILYELLTGLRPIDAARLKKAALTEMIRIVQEEEPSKPSTRLSTNESLPSLAALRKTEPKKLMALLRGELDWVVLKCLEKQRDRRYETANALSRDIQRYLADEPVEARPPSVSYRMGKFMRRNRAAVVTVCAVAAALLLGVMAATWQAVRATRAEADERLAKENAVKLAKENAKLASDEKKQRQKAEQQRARAVAESQRADRERLTAETAQYAMQLKLADVDFDRFEIENALRTLKSTKPELRGWEFAHLEMKCNSRLRTFAGDDSYTCIAITGDGKLVASGNRKLVRVWEFTNRRLVKELEGDALKVDAVAFSPDGKLLAALTKKSVRVWDVPSWKQLGQAKLDQPMTEPGFDSRPTIVFDAQGEHLAAAMHDNVRVWNATLSRQLFSHKSETRTPEAGDFTGIAFDPQGKRLVVRLIITSRQQNGRKSFDEEYLLLDAKTGKQVASSGREPASNLFAYSLGFDPQGKWFFTAGAGRLRLRDPATAKVQREIKVAIGPSAVLSGDGSRMAIVRPASAEVNVYKMPDMELLQSLSTGDLSKHIRSIGMTSDGRRLVVASQGFRHQGSVVGWTLEGNEAAVTIAEVKRPQRISGITSSMKAGWLAVALSETEPFDPKKIRELKTPFQPKHHSSINFYSLKTGKLLSSLPKKKGRIWLLKSSRDGQKIITASPMSDIPIRIWDVANRKIKREISIPNRKGKINVITHLSADAAAKLVCVTMEEQDRRRSRRLDTAPGFIRIVVWESATGKVVWKTKWKNEMSGSAGLGSRNSAVLDPSGNRLVVIHGTFKKGLEDPETGNFRGSISSTVKLYNLSTKKALARLKFKDSSMAATFSPDSKNIYLRGRGVFRWHPVSGEQTRISDKYFQHLTVSPDNRRLIALEMHLMRPSTVVWIDPKTRQEVYQVPNKKMRYSFNGVHLTGDGRTLIVTDARKVLMLRSPDRIP